MSKLFAVTLSLLFIGNVFVVNSAVAVECNQFNPQAIINLLQTEKFPDAKEIKTAEEKNFTSKDIKEMFAVFSTVSEKSITFNFNVDVKNTEFGTRFGKTAPTFMELFNKVTIVSENSQIIQKDGFACITESKMMKFGKSDPKLTADSLTISYEGITGEQLLKEIINIYAK
jgi:hypothetical protein